MAPRSSLIAFHDLFIEAVLQLFPLGRFHRTRPLPDNWP